MTANLSYNWMTTSNAAGLFNTTSVGYVQGLYIEDPVSRFALRGGVLSTSETIPMWGGVGVAVTTDPNTGTNPPDSTLGGIVSRATNVTAGAASELAGFSVLNQNYAATIVPGGVPLSGSGMQVNWLALGSGARIPVAVAPALASSAPGSSVLQQVSWDFVAQQLIPYQAAYNSASVSSATYTSSTGIIALTFGAAPAGTSPTVGAYFSVSGLAGTGVAPLNGNWALVSSSGSGTVLNLQGPIGLGSLTITGSTGTLAAGGGALPCEVLDIVSNSMTVSYNATTLAATWNQTGTVAVIRI